MYIERVIRGHFLEGNRVEPDVGAGEVTESGYVGPTDFRVGEFFITSAIGAAKMALKEGRGEKPIIDAAKSYEMAISLGSPTGTPMTIAGSSSMIPGNLGDHKADAEGRNLLDHPALLSIEDFIAEMGETGKVPERGDYWNPAEARRQVEDRPPPLKPFAAEEFDAIDRLLEAVTADSVEDWAASRAEAIEDVKLDLSEGKVPFGEPAELAEQALKEREEVKEARAAMEAEIRSLEGERDDAAAKMATARKKAIDAGATAPQLGGSFSKSWKRFRRRVSAQDTRSLDPVKKLRDEVSSTLLPKAVRDFGKSAEAEIGRLGRRINKEALRAVENVAEKAPWIRGASALLAIVLPPLAVVHYIVVAGVAAVEVTHAYRQKREIDHQLRKLKNALLIQIAELLAEAERYEKLAAELEEQRRMLEELARQERARRLAVAGSLFDEEAERQKQSLVVGGAAVAAAAGALVLTKRPLIAAIPVAAFVAWAVNSARTSPLKPYRDCVKAGAAEEACRERWIQDRARSIGWEAG